MAVPLAAKVGAAGIFAAGVPTSVVVWKNFFSFNEIEKTVLEDTSTTWEVTSENSETKVIAKATANVTKNEESSPTSYKWECEITATMPSGKTKDDLKTYLTSKLNSSSDKENHRWYLVKACSKDRKPIETSHATTQKTALELSVSLLENKLFTYLLGEAES